MATTFSSLISSTITFWQSCVLTIDFPPLNKPHWVQNFIKVITDFQSAATSFFGQIPELDIRFKFVIVDLAFPIILGILLYWYFQHDFLISFYIYAHLVFPLSIGIAFSAITRLSKENIIYFNAPDGFTVLFLTIFGVIFAIIYFPIIDFSPNLELTKNPAIVEDISDFYVGSITKEIYGENVLYASDIFQMVREKGLNIKPKLVNIKLGVILLLISLAAFGTFLGISGIFVYINKEATLWGCCFLLPISIILFVLSILKMTKFGQKLLLAIRNFITKFGLKCIMLGIDFLYIPILSSLIDNLIPVTAECTGGASLTSNANVSAIDFFIKHDAHCIMKKNTIKNFYDNQTRMLKDTSLKWGDDVIKVMWPTIIHSVVFILIGIPFLWGKIIKSNRDFILPLRAYGKDVEEKWITLTERLGTSGIFMFNKFKVNHCYWGVFLYFTKFIVVFIKLLTDFISPWFTIAYTVFYTLMFILYIIFRPFKYTVNNILEIIFQFLSICNSVFPILNLLNIHYSEKILSYFSICIVCFPIISFGFIFIYKKTYKEDPTIMTKEIKYICKEGVKSRMFKDIELKLTEGDNYKNKKEYKITIEKGAVDSIVKFNKDELASRFKANKFLLADNFDNMYKLIDIMIDNEIVEIMMRYLMISAYIAMFCLGFYINGQYDSSLVDPLLNNYVVDFK